MSALRITLPAAAVRNPMATALADRSFRSRIVKPKAGKASYSRKDKHKGARGW